MKIIATKELHHISGGYKPPFNPDTEPCRAGIANWGGYANNYLNQSLGVDITGDNLANNKLLGIGIFASSVFILSGVLISLPNPIWAFSFLIGVGLSIELYARYS